ncbi:MAG TPA: hypothetical protein PLN69_10985 [bacterium]|nr:hypothetical protein [bacterium]
MHRSKRSRYHIPGSIHELTFACYRHLPLLTTYRTNKNLAGAVIKAAQTQQFKVVAYVFMPTRLLKNVAVESLSY